ncbi:SLOG family protein [uncultured Mailhella sp.]|uniref:SLOG family protein n=1 Tax=uncultured Mailhella sp. TaxID=1981031 RepID=UPI0032082EDA
MKLAVVGSRNFSDYAWMEHCLLRRFSVEEIDAVISGGAKGADSLAARFAGAHGLPLFVVPADWKTHGKKAGPLRNTDIVARADALVAFWDGVSRGTRDAIVKARLAGKLVEVFPCARSAGTLIADEADSSTPSKEAKDQS